MIKPLLQRIQKLHHFLDRWWFAPFLAVIACVDLFLVIFPVDGLLVSSILLKKQRWFRMTFWTWIGSSSGMLLMVIVSALYGMSFVQSFFPGILETGAWKWALEFFTNHGLWLLFLSGVFPLAQQPATIVVGLAGSPLEKVAWVIFLSRGIKIFVIGYVSAKAPHILKKLGPVQAEAQVIQALDAKDELLKNS